MFCLLLILWGLILCSWASGAIGNVWMTSLSLTITSVLNLFNTWMAPQTLQMDKSLGRKSPQCAFLWNVGISSHMLNSNFVFYNPWRFWIYCQYTCPSETTISLASPGWESANAFGGIMPYLNWLSFPLGLKTLKKWQPSFISFSSQYLNNFSQLFLLVCMAWLIHSLGLGK